MFCWVTWPTVFSSNKPSKHVFKLVHVIETFQIIWWSVLYFEPLQLFVCFFSGLDCCLREVSTNQRWISWPISSQRCHDWRIMTCRDLTQMMLWYWWKRRFRFGKPKCEKGNVKTNLSKAAICWQFVEKRNPAHQLQEYSIKLRQLMYFACPTSTTGSFPAISEIIFGFVFANIWTRRIWEAPQRSRSRSFRSQWMVFSHILVGNTKRGLLDNLIGTTNEPPWNEQVSKAPWKDAESEKEMNFTSNLQFWGTKC